MSRRIKKHLWYYISLLFMLSFGMFLALQVSFSTKLQVSIIITTAFWYVLWGIAHHIIEHNLSSKVVIEYVLIGSLGMSILFFLIMAIK